MKIFRNTTCLLSAVFFFLTFASGCTTTQQPVAVTPVPTCSDVGPSGVAPFSDNEIEEMLDGALSANNIDDCWVKVMKSCFEERRDIPLRHLAKGVKVFNQQKYKNIFHTAVYRYLSAIAKGEGEYGKEERKLLEVYCSYLINNSGSKDNDKLRQAMLLCKNLDPNLYSRLFR